MKSLPGFVPLKDYNKRLAKEIDNHLAELIEGYLEQHVVPSGEDKGYLRLADFAWWLKQKGR